MCSISPANPNKYLPKPALYPHYGGLFLGMKFGEYSGSQFILSHEFIGRFGSKFLNGFLTIEDDYINQWLSGRDIRHFKPVDFPYGSVVVIRDLRGRILGGGKILPDSIRNLLPPRLVN